MPKKKILIEEVNKNIIRINLGFVSMYVYNDNSNTICIDAGLNTKDLQKAFDNIKIDPVSVNTVLLTHSDRDHTGGIKLFQKAKVFMSKEEEQMINGTTARFFKLIHNKKPECKINYLKDGEELNIGGINVKCISTPGHTPGSMSFLINNKFLFAGDILNIKNGQAVMDRGFIQMNKSQQGESIKNLAKFKDIELLLTAHTGYTNDFEKAMNKWR